MSALLSIGEANHAILNADAEISHAASCLPVGPTETRAALAAAQAQLVHARAVLAAVRLSLRTQGVFDALAYHEDMVTRLREGARLQRVAPHRGLNASADRHEAYAAALRTLVGPTETPGVVLMEGGV